VTVWDTKNFAVKSQTINVAQGEPNVWSVATSSNPTYIFSGNSDGHVYRWIPNDPEWTSGKKEEKKGTSDKDAVVNHTINSVSFSHKYGWIAAGGDGNSIEIYDVNLQHVQSLAGHDGTIWYVAFDPQGSRLAYGGTDRILRIFNLDEMQNIKSSSPDKLYQEAQKMTGFLAK
jgi:WD40 repeat protein